MPAMSLLDERDHLANDPKLAALPIRPPEAVPYDIHQFREESK